MSKLKIVVGGIILSIIISIILVISTPGQKTPLDDAIGGANKEIEVNVNDDIISCQDQKTVECDQLMKQWFDECQKSHLKEITSCHDGRLESYLKFRDILP